MPIRQAGEAIRRLPDACIWSSGQNSEHEIKLWVFAGDTNKITWRMGVDRGKNAQRLSHWNSQYLEAEKNIGNSKRQVFKEFILNGGT